MVTWQRQTAGQPAAAPMPSPPAAALLPPAASPAQQEPRAATLEGQLQEIRDQLAAKNAAAEETAAALEAAREAEARNNR
eukprot:4899327-Prymnesium_polylepis.1